MVTLTIYFFARGIQINLKYAIPQNIYQSCLLFSPQSATDSLTLLSARWINLCSSCIHILRVKVYSDQWNVCHLCYPRRIDFNEKYRNMVHIIETTLLVSEQMFHWIGSGDEYDPRGFNSFENGLIRPNMTMEQCVAVVDQPSTNARQWDMIPCDQPAAYVCELQLGMLVNWTFVRSTTCQ